MKPMEEKVDQIQKQEERKFEEKILLIHRVSKKTTGGNNMTFTVLAAVGDGAGKLGVGYGRSQEIPPAIKKAILLAKKNIMTVPLYKSTIPHEIKVKYKAAKVLLKPAPEGTGLKVGSVMRPLLELAGVKNASGKVIQSRNQVINTYAVLKALGKLKTRVRSK